MAACAMLWMLIAVKRGGLHPGRGALRWGGNALLEPPRVDPRTIYRKRRTEALERFHRYATVLRYILLYTSIYRKKRKAERKLQAPRATEKV